MAYFGSEGVSRPFAAGTPKSGGYIGGAAATGGTYGTGGIVASSKAPYIPSEDDLTTKAGTGQRFPFTVREIVLNGDVILTGDQEALIIQ